MELDHLAFSPKIDLRELIKREFERRKSINPKYSLRAFSIFLGISHAALSEMLSGKRRISAQNVKRVGSALGWSEKDVELALQAQQKDPLNFSQLTDGQIEILGRWYHSTILELFLLDEFNGREEWIAEALGLDLQETRKALSDLESAGLLRRSKKGMWAVTSFKTSTLGNVKSKKAILNLQKQLLEKQIKALDEVPVEEQSSMGITIPMDLQDLPEARKIIYRCLKDLSLLLNRKGVRRSEVYRLQLGLFPLTRVRSVKP